MTELNRFLFHLVNKVWTSPALDPCMIFLGSINDYGVIWLVLLGVLAALSGKTGRWAALTGLAGLVAGLACSEVLKSIVMQPRPFVSLPDVRLLVSPSSSYSFPSVNTTYAFAASSGASLTARRLLGRLPAWGWGLLALAIAVSYSRVYVGVHYPGDVLGGALLGISIGWLVASIGAKVGQDGAFERQTIRDEGDRTG
ncbi:MAG: phosphatase PAP2 family protein [Actinomycetota bacterium]|nr:phosphatase PAP2 family protein [Actinomycetota bacterium]